MYPLTRIAALTLVSLCFRCGKKHEFKSSGRIVGLNVGACATCGGLYVVLDGDTATKYILNYSDNLNTVILELDAKYLKEKKPIPILLDWTSLPTLQGTVHSDWIRATNMKEND